MFKEMLDTMTEMMGEALKEKKRFLPLWYREWFDLFRKAYEPGRKVIYTSIYAFPMEILNSFNVIPFDFELAGALMSTMNQGISLMTEAEAMGYTRDICSFHRASLGCFYKGYLPKPDLLTTTSFYCDGKGKTNDLLSSLWNVDSFLLDVPHEITCESVKYVEKQLMTVADKIAHLCGESLDMDRLKAAVKSTNRSRRLHREILSLLKAGSMLMNPKDMIGFSLHGNLFSGKPIKEILENQLINDLKEKASKKGMQQERHRIFWFSWLPTYQETVFKTLKNNGVGIPVCETFRMYWDEIDEHKPFEGLALKCLKNPFVGPVSRRTEGIEQVVREYGIHGAILFETPACRHSNTAHLLIKEAFSRLGLPFIMLDMDISDPRSYQSEQVKTRIEAFIEVMDSACDRKDCSSPF